MPDRPLALIVGASRGLGLGLVRELLNRGYEVIATVRHHQSGKELRELADREAGRLRIETLDMNDPAQIGGFGKVLGTARLDLLFVNAGVAGPEHRSAQHATAEEVGTLMFTNAVAPIRLARSLVGHVRNGQGVIAFMSSRMGSVAENTGGHELYRASKAALNSLARGFWPEVSGQNLTVLSLHPGWVRTDMGGTSAPVDVETSVRGIADVLERERGRHRHAFLDYQGQEIAW